MVKVKRLRTIDAVIVGWRPGKEEGTVGSLILGLYDADGELHVVGHTSGLKAKQKRELVETLAPYATGEQRLGRPEPLGGRPRPRVGRAAPGAGGRGELRPRERRPDPPRREDPALARGQEPARVHVRPAELAGAPDRGMTGPATAGSWRRVDRGRRTEDSFSRTSLEARRRAGLAGALAMTGLAGRRGRAAEGGTQRPRCRVPGAPYSDTTKIKDVKFGKLASTSSKKVRFKFQVKRQDDNQVKYVHAVCKLDGSALQEVRLPQEVQASRQGQAQVQGQGRLRWRPAGRVEADLRLEGQVDRARR